jgi:GrpE
MKIEPVRSDEGSRAERREGLLRQFDLWLREALAEEQPPRGLAAQLVSAIENGKPLPPIEGHCDLHTLWSAVTALTQEVKLQSRTFKQVSETLAGLPEAVANAIGPQSSAELDHAIVGEESTGEEQEEQEEEEEQAPTGSASEPWRPGKQQIDLLVDLRDRFERGFNSVREAGAALAASRPSGWRRWFLAARADEANVSEVLSALEKGYTLTLERLDQALSDYHISRIDSEGRVFDSRCMTAVDVEETDSVPEGTVVAVYRAGYEWEGEVFRSAQVRVARKQRIQRVSDREEINRGD